MFLTLFISTAPLHLLYLFSLSIFSFSYLHHLCYFKNGRNRCRICVQKTAFDICRGSGMLVIYVVVSLDISCLQCFDTVGWAAGRASGL